MRAALEAARAAPTSPSSPRSIRCAVTRAPRRAASTPRSARATRGNRTPSTPSRAATISPTRTPSRSCAARRPPTSSNSSTWASSSIATRRQARHARVRRRIQARTYFVGDITGQALLVTLYDQILKAGVKVYEEWFATSLIHGGRRCRGVVALEMITGELHLLRSKAVIVAPAVWAGCTSRARTR